jgi:hypothetical protein
LRALAPPLSEPDEIDAPPADADLKPFLQLRTWDGMDGRVLSSVVSPAPPTTENAPLVSGGRCC